MDSQARHMQLKKTVVGIAGFALPPHPRGFCLASTPLPHPPSFLISFPADFLCDLNYEQKLELN